MVNFHHTSVGSNRDSTIDGLRGLAALAVVVHHVLHFAVRHSSNPDVVAFSALISVDYVDWGRFGVVLFFLISGYVVPEYLLRGGYLSVFAGQRALRIYPVFWVSIIFVLLYKFLSAGELVPLRTVIGNATLFPQVFSAPWLSGVYWTLNIEIIFYVICILLCAVGSIKKVLVWQVLCGFAVLSTVLPILLNEFQALNVRLPVQFTGIYVAFLFSGVLLKFGAGGEGLRSFFIAMLPFAAVPVVAGLFFPVTGGFKLDDVVTIISAHALALFVFLYFVYFRKGTLGGLWLRLGKSSYSLYLFHWPICALVIDSMGLGGFGSLAIAVVASVIASIVVAELAYRYLEKPSIEAGKRWRARFE